MKSKRIEREKKRRRENSVVILLAVILSVLLVCAVSVLYIQDIEKKHIQELAETERWYIERINEAQDYYEEQIESLEAEISDREARILELKNMIQGIYDTNELEAKREYSIYHKYWYVIRDATVEDGMTMDLIRHVDEVAKEYDLNPHFIWAIIDLESDYDVDIYNTTTNAGGLGQFMPGTGKFVYEQLLGEEHYDHATTPTDPYISIRMIAAYIRYNFNYYYDLRPVLRLYSGSTNDTYYDSVAQGMRRFGYDINVTTYI